MGLVALSALPAQGGACVISDVITQEQGYLVSVSVLWLRAGSSLGHSNYRLQPSTGCTVLALFWPLLPPLLQAITLTMVGNCFSWS